MTPSVYNSSGPNPRNGRLFGVPGSWQEARTVLLPVPWEVTCCYGSGTSRAPGAILQASPQMDLWHPLAPEAWRLAPGLAPEPAGLRRLNDRLRPRASARMAWLEAGSPARRRAAMGRVRDEVNAGCETMVRQVREWTGARMDAGRQVALLGGDHSTALGLIQAVAQRTPEFGILQIDAHMDLRSNFEGFIYSHASVMLHALECPQVQRLVQVGGRDFCQEEASRVEASRGRIRVFDDRDMKREQLGGVSWKHLCARIVDTLPEQVHVSFDIDGLDPSLCPHTGTPVPGGLSYAEAVCLIERVVDSGRRIVGFDLCEVAPGPSGEWDAAVGARLLFELSVLMTLSREGGPTRRRGRKPVTRKRRR